MATLKMEIGERLRLQNVLKHFLDNPPEPEHLDHQPIAQALDEHYARSTNEALTAGASRRRGVAARTM